jgi:ribosomal protein L7/L12
MSAPFLFLLIGAFIVIDALILLGILASANRRRTEALRQQGLYPAPGKGTDADVAKLLAAGRKIDAIKIYREIHGVGLKEAKEAVERMAKCVDPSATP